MLLRVLLVILVVTVCVPVCAQYNDPGPTGLAAMEQYQLLPYLWTGVQVKCATSYDRTDDNIDRTWFLYSNGDEKVLMDEQGPGCIYRIWMTSLATGKYRVCFYLDNETTPRFSAIWDSLYNYSSPPFVAPFVGNNGVSSGGYYSYLPIPFRQRCKVVMENPGTDWFYYNINYHTYTDPSVISTWTGSENKAAAAAVWNSTGNPNPAPDAYTIQGSSAIAPGGVVTVLDRQGSGSVNSISIRVPQVVPNDAASEALLENMRIRAYWDGESVPSVDAPVGEFFGTGLGEHTVNALPLRMDIGSGGWYRCYFPMPYGSSARIELYNGDTTAVNLVEWDVRVGSMPDAADMLTQGKIGYFHAFHNREYPTAQGRDYLVLQSAGRGCLVGCVVTMRGFEERFDFLEGDERIHIDGSYTPSIYGTGTEDLFNCGWYYKYGEMSVQTHGVPAKITSGPYRVSSYRMFIPDKIPYYSSIRFGLEHGAVNDWQGNYSSTAFYYEVDQPGLVLSDELDIYDSESESAHGHMYSGHIWQGALHMRYGGDDSTIIGDAGRRLEGYSEFTLSIDPANRGIKLRRRLDYNIPNQTAQVYIDGQLAGTWYDAGSAADRWMDSDFEIPAQFTAGKSTIRVKVQSDAWTEFRYRAYSYVSSDTAALGAVSNFMAIGLTGQNRLLWTNPSDPDIKRVVIRCSTSGYPAGPADGEEVCNSRAFPDAQDSCLHRSLSTGTTYFYSAFVYDSTGRYSTVVHASAAPGSLTSGTAALLPDGSEVILSDQVVTAVFDDCFYVGDENRSSGIRVSGVGTGLQLGDRVNVWGMMSTHRDQKGAALERTITGVATGGVTPGTPLQPLAMNCRAVGGARVEPNKPGVQGGVGLNNIGLLVKISGKVTAVMQGTSEFYLDDGSGVTDGTGIMGVLVKYPYANIPLVVGDITTVTGIVRGNVPQDWMENRRFIQMRSLEDLYTVQSAIGYVSGLVRDQYGRTVPRASVVLMPGGIKTTTADDGSYLLSVGGGNYSITAYKLGYSNTTQQIEITNGRILPLNFTMPAIGAEVCANGNFENGFFSFWGGRIGNGWGSCQNNSAKGASWAEYNFGGGHNMVQKLTITNAATDAGITSGAGGLTPGYMYRWSGWVYCEQPGYVVKMTALGTPVSNAGIPSSGTVIPTTPGKWCYHEITGTISSTWALTAYAWVDYQSGATGAVYFDDFSLMVGSW